MSLSSTPVKVQFDVSGGPPASFPFAFRFWSTGEVKAVLTASGGDIDLVLGTDYTVSTPGAGGTLTRVGTWPAAIRLTIYRELDLSQDTDLANNTTQDAEVYESMVDRAVAITQQVAERTDRLVRFPVSEPTATPDMPSATERANKFLAFDADGTPTPAAGAVGEFPVTDYIKTLLDDNDEAAAQLTLGLQGAVAAHLAMKSFIESMGFTYNLSTLSKDNWIAQIANRHGFGDIVTAEIETPPVTYDEASIGGSEYNPVIPRHDADHDVSTAEAPDLVAKLLAVKLNVLGVEDFPVSSVVGSRITFTSTTPVERMLAAVQNAGLVNRWFSESQSATFAASGANYAMAGRQYAIEVGGVLYPIVALSVAGRYIDVTGSPASASTASISPFGIAGEPSKIRLRMLSGSSPVAGGDLDGEVIISLAKMDRTQTHRHYTGQGDVAGVNGNPGFPAYAYGFGSALGFPLEAGQGTPRTGKTTDPRGYGVAVYTWARRLLAKTWTNP